MSNCHLRAAAPAALGDLVDLFCEPSVYEYLWDGSPPEAQVVDDWLADGLELPSPFGIWVLESAGGDLLGVASLKPVEGSPGTAELVYALHPSAWGKGLATSMSRAVLERAFGDEGIESVLAGADAPNVRSFAVMKRLGFTLHREVEYPAGPGAEYLLTRSAFAKLEPVESVPILEA